MLKKTLIVIFFIETISLLILFSFRFFNIVYLKLNSSEPLIVYFSKNHLPHPVLRKSKNNYNAMNDNNLKDFDPNTVLYFHNENRFGEKKNINNKSNNDDYFIYLIGGSTVDGTGADKPNETIDASIKRQIKKLNCKNSVKIFNEAVSGNSSKQDFLNISLRLLPHNSPDMILSLQGWNDFLSYAGSRHNEISPLAKYWTTREQMTYKYINSPNFYNNFILLIKNETFLGILLSSMLDTYKRYFFIDLENRKQLSLSENIKILEKNYFYFQKQSRLISMNNNVKYFHFLQPSLLFKNFPTQKEMNILNGVKNTFSYGKRDNYIFSKTYWDNLDKFYKTIVKNEEFFNSDWIYDFSKIFLNSKDTDFIDHGHLSKIAQSKIGISIFNEIKSEINCVK